MSTEFSLEGFTDFCKLKWSEARAAKNGKLYRKAAMTPEFKEILGEQREYLRQHGISVYNEFGKDAVFDWTSKGTRKTKEEYEQQQEKRTEACLTFVKEALCTAAAADRPEDYEKIQERINSCSVIDELEYLAENELTCGKDIVLDAQHAFSLQ